MKRNNMAFSTFLYIFNGILVNILKYILSLQPITRASFTGIIKYEMFVSYRAIKLIHRKSICLMSTINVFRLLLTEQVY